ncbi:MAG: hypothetical protein WCA46_30570 [Actinocatenispora sp.]
MSFDVHLSVVFHCGRNDGVAALARRHLPRLDDDAPWEAGQFLTALGDRTGENPGPKGGLSLWGLVGNYTDPDDFVSHLEAFWLDLFFVEGGPGAYAHVIVFYEYEQFEFANAVEISLADESADRSAATLVVRTHEELPFGWLG